jgi:hypothetical protein
MVFIKTKRVGSISWLQLAKPTLQTVIFAPQQSMRMPLQDTRRESKSPSFRIVLMGQYHQAGCKTAAATLRQEITVQLTQMNKAGNGFAEAEALLADYDAHSSAEIVPALRLYPIPEVRAF